MATLDGSSGQTTSTLLHGVAAGARGWGPKRGPCTIHGVAAGPYHSSFDCDLTPDPEEAGQRIVVIPGNRGILPAAKMVTGPLRKNSTYDFLLTPPPKPYHILYMPIWFWNCVQQL